MKLPSKPLLDSIGFMNPGQKLLYLAALLKSGLTTSPAITISAAVPAVVGRPEIIAQTAKPARPASAAVDGGANPGVGFGELYLNSPAYLPGIPIPAIPQKPASAAVVGVPGIVAVPAVPAVIVPAVVPIKGWEDAIAITPSATLINIMADLNYYSNVAMIGAPVSIAEITSPTLEPKVWLDTKASNTPTDIGRIDQTTVEQYFYSLAKDYLTARPVVGTIVKTTKLVNGLLLPIKRVTLSLACTGYDINSDSLQLNKIIAL